MGSSSYKELDGSWREALAQLHDDYYFRCVVITNLLGVVFPTVAAHQASLPLLACRHAASCDSSHRALLGHGIHNEP